MRRHAALWHRLPPAPLLAPPAALATEKLSGHPGNADTPGAPLLGQRRLPPTAPPAPRRRCGAVLDSGLALGAPLASHLPQDGSPPPPALTWAQRRCRRGGRSAAGPGRGRAGTRPRGGREREVPAGLARPRYSPGGGVPAGTRRTGAAGSAPSYWAAIAGDIPAHLKYPSPVLPSSLALYFRFGFMSLLPPQRQRSAPPSGSCCLEPFFSPEKSFPPHHAIWQCQHLSVPFSITCHNYVFMFSG